MADYAKFEGWILPATRQSISSSAKMTVHEYRWRQGGTAEDHGRGLYTFRYSCLFTNDKRFSPPLYPDALNALRRLYELRAVGTLELPDIGRVPCRLIEWSEDQQGGFATSAEASLAFLEEDGHRFLGAAIDPSKVQTLRTATDKWTAVVESKRPAQAVTPVPDIRSSEARAFDLFDQITEAANTLIAFRDQQQLFGELLQTKIDGMLSLFRDADRAMWLDDPDNWEVVYAMKELWAATIEAGKTPQDDRGEPRVHLVQQTSTVMQVSNEIYGSTARAGDLLALNNFREAMAIPAGTRVIYLPEAA